MHRDLKPSNILLGQDGKLKIADFDLARQVAIGHKKLTHEVVTLYYRPPEILLGFQFYTDSIDMWSVGCIFYELATFQMLFKSETELEQIDKIFKKLGSPTKETWSGYQNSPLVRDPSFMFRQYEIPNKNEFRMKGNEIVLSEEVLDDDGLDLMLLMLQYDPDKRISAE